MNINWKQKYQEIKLKYKDTADLAFRLGVEEGMRQGQVQQAQQAQASAEAAMQGQPGQDPNEVSDQEMPGQEQDGSELDQHIGQLESMLQKTENGSTEYLSLKKSVDGIKAFKSNMKQSYDLKKSEKAIAAIGKAMKSPFTMSKSATKNMSEPAKKALNMQERIVEDLMKSMAEEEKKATESVNKTLGIEQLLKG